MSVINFIQHYQRSIEKNQDDETRLLHCLEKLHGLQVRVPHLQNTGVGRTVNALRKRPGLVGEAARKLVASWKQIVEAHVSSEEESGQSPAAHQDAQRAVNGDTKSTTPTSLSPRPPKSGSSSRSIKSEPEESPPSKKSRHRETSRTPEPSTSSEQHRRHKDRSGHDSSKEHRSERNGHHHHHEKSSSSSDKHKTRSESPPKKHKSEDHRSRSDDSKNNRSDDKNKRSEDSNNKSSSSSKSNKISTKHENDKKHSDKSKHKGESCSSKKITIKSDPTFLCFEDAISPRKLKNKKSGDRKEDVKKIKKEPVDEAMDLPLPKFAQESPPKRSGKIKKEPQEDEEIYETGGEGGGGESPVGAASFEEALGFIDGPSSSKLKKEKSSKEKKKKSGSVPSAEKVKPLPKSEEISAAILSLPPINPNYRPLPQVPLKSRHNASEEDSLASMMSNKVQRTKVYSGVRCFNGGVPSLEDMCIKVLQDNLDELGDLGWIPFYLIKSVLARASAQQLMNIEYFNPRLTEDTDELWHNHVNTEFRGADRADGECWRDVYERSVEEREDKLGSLMERIRQNNEARKAPQRTTKLAYMNTQVKPPRSVIRQQMKHGTSRGSLPAPMPRRTYGDDEAGPSGTSSHASTIARTVGLLREGPSMSIKSKKRPAPLMQKTLKFMKTSFRR